MKKRLEKLFGLVSALSFVCTPTILLIVGLWMIYNVGLWIGLVLSIVAYFASVWELFELQMYSKDRKKKNQNKTK
nr:MAG TPA: hypothetical protein [Caudoviricetes sp.]